MDTSVHRLPAMMTRRHALKYGTSLAVAAAVTTPGTSSQAAIQARKSTFAKVDADYPRIVAHRGFSSACPENTLPAFGAAVAMGTDEIELDVWPTTDGELVILHDPSLNRTTNLTGKVTEMSWAEVRKADAGIRQGEVWTGIPIPRLEEVWEALSGLCVFNVHVKDLGPDALVIKKVRQLAEKFGIVDQVYLAINVEHSDTVIHIAPEFHRCCLTGKLGWNLVDTAIKHEFHRVQFFNKYCDEEHIRKAHEHGILCNLFFADEVEIAERFYGMGIDALLTNSLAQVLPVRDRMRANAK